MNGLLDYTKAFLGYGNLSAPVWFIGLEEGGGQDLAEIEQRVRAWERRGAEPVEDLAGFHREIGVTRFFDGRRPVLQRTWNALMKTLQAYRAAPADAETRRRLQSNEFGATDGPVALLELLPLPSKDKISWIYAPLADQIPMLASRKTYETAMRPIRIQRLRTIIEQHSPRVVVCYGLSELNSWQSIVREPQKEQRIGKHRCILHIAADTSTVLVPHPGNARSTDFWEQLGSTLREASR